MKIVVQRVVEASVVVDGSIVGQIGAGLLLLVGLSVGDSSEQLVWMARKVVGLRIFNRDGLMQDSVLDMGGEILAVSQFTLLGDCRKGKRPSFVNAMPTSSAKSMFEEFLLTLEKEFGRPIQTGRFGAYMQINLVNDGPVTIILER